MNKKTSRDENYFDELYAANPDPWNFCSSDYERQKYDATLALLGKRNFTSGFEAGCSIGILTHRLAAYCQRLLAVDIAEKALQEAQRRCESLPHVAFSKLRIPEEWPRQDFDLVLLSEVLYFLVPEDVALVAARACTSVLEGGLVLLVNFTEPTEEPCSGDEAAEIFIGAAARHLALVDQRRELRFRIDVLQAS